MKNLIKKIGVLIFLFVVFTASNSFMPISTDNNGVDVVVVKYEDGQLALGLDCGDGLVYYPATSGTILVKNGIISLWNWRVQLPEGNCYIPSGEEGDYDVYVYSQRISDYVRIKFTPGGLAILKYPAY